MSYVDYTYFINDIDIPVNVMGSDQYASVINRWEPKIMECLLGYELNALLDADLDDGVPQSDRFKDLINGKEFSFSYGSRTVNTKWNGIKNTELISLSSYYVYFNDRNQNEQFNSGAGQLQSLPENSTKVDFNSKLTYVWGEMLKLYGEVPQWVNLELYSLIDSAGYDHFNALPSAYNFLLANIADYPEWVFKPLEGKNIYSI